MAPADWPDAFPAAPRTVVVVTCSAADAEVLADQCFGFGASAVGEAAADDGTTVRLTADLPTERLAEALAALPGASAVAVDPDVATAWRSHLRPVVVADRLMVRPPWCEVPDGAATVADVLVDPGAAFGSGTHPTTVGCLAALVSLADRGHLAGASVLDVGCGTGVLGLAALSLGAATVVGVDTDPAAVVATAGNAARNGFSGRTEVRLGSLDAAGSTFGVVLANLLAPVFDDLGRDLAGRVGDGGVLIVSGLLADQVDRAVAPAVAAGLALAEVVPHDDWIVAVLVRPVHTPVTDR